MDKQQLIMLVGEQTLLTEERAVVAASRHSLQAKLLNVYNDITATHAAPRWLAQAQTILTDLHAVQTRQAELDTRIREIAVLTGR